MDRQLKTYFLTGICICLLHKPRVLLNYWDSFQRISICWITLTLVWLVGCYYKQECKDDRNQHTLWCSVQLRALAKLPECSSEGQMTTPQRILDYLDNTQHAISTFRGEHRLIIKNIRNLKKKKNKPARRCLMMNLRTAGINCFSVRVSMASSHRNRHTTSDHKHKQKQAVLKMNYVLTAPSRGHLHFNTKTKLLML